MRRPARNPVEGFHAEIVAGNGLPVKWLRDPQDVDTYRTTAVKGGHGDARFMADRQPDLMAGQVNSRRLPGRVDQHDRFWCAIKPPPHQLAHCAAYLRSCRVSSRAVGRGNTDHDQVLFGICRRDQWPSGGPGMNGDRHWRHRLPQPQTRAGAAGQPRHPVAAGMCSPFITSVNAPSLALFPTTALYSTALRGPI